MTLINLSIYDPSCSWCWNKYKKISKKQILFKINKELHWVCCKEHRKELIDTEKEIYPKKKFVVKDLWVGDANNLNEKEMEDLIEKSLNS